MKRLESFPRDPDHPSDIEAIADALVGVAATPPEGYDPALLAKSTDELTELFVEAARQDLEFNEQ